MLYHYTSIESLGLILKNKTLCFSSLGIVDDPDEEEGYAGEIVNLGRSIYVSCWTCERQESIPMWEQYSGKSHGVRIGLPDLPFKRFSSKEMGIEPAGGNQDWLFNVLEFQDKYNITFPVNIIVKNVEYTDDEALIHPNVSTEIQNDRYISDGEKSVSFGKMGAYKKQCWCFQNETRYLLYTLPRIDDVTNDDEFRRAVKTLKNPNWKPDTDRLFIGLDEFALSQIDIVRGPKMSDGERHLLDCLLKEHKIASSQCHDSTIRIR